jgi:hypothetical protein
MKKYIIVPISKCKEVIRNETRKQLKTWKKIWNRKYW